MLSQYSAASTQTHTLHSESTHAFAPPRGVATRRFRQPIADIGHVKGWLHWRLLGASITRDARAAVQPENSGPFVLATAPIFLDPCSPGSSLLCLGNRIPSNQSLTRQSPVPPRRSTTSSCPPRNGRAVLRKEKWVWRLETCDDALCLGTAPHGCRSGWTSCKRSRLR